MKSVRELLPCQVMDPDKGSFMVDVAPTGKYRMGSDGRNHVVMRAPADREDAQEFIVVGPHPQHFLPVGGLAHQYRNGDKREKKEKKGRKKK